MLAAGWAPRTSKAAVSFPGRCVAIRAASVSESCPWRPGPSLAQRRRSGGETEAGPALSFSVEDTRLEQIPALSAQEEWAGSVGAGNGREACLILGAPFLLDFLSGMSRQD